MSDFYQRIIDNNKKWVEGQLNIDPDYFKDLAKSQNPPLLWIGCSDSRVPANEITGTKSGEIFVHRNVANLVKFLKKSGSAFNFPLLHSWFPFKRRS